MIATVLSSDLGVKVLDRTGVTDVFNITWEYGPDENTPGVLRSLTVSSAGPPTAANVFTTLEQQLGLKLERIKGPRGYLVIDHIERPIPDLPLTTPPLRAMGAGGR